MAAPLSRTTQMKVLIIYSTIDGHTLQICRRIQEKLVSSANQVTLANLEDSAPIDPALFDKIVVGASVRYGKHRPALVKFLQKNGPLLSLRTTALFTVNLVARKPEKNQPDTNPYMIKLLKQLGWRPAHLAVFAGKIDYPRYSMIDRQVIRLIMWMTGGPTGSHEVIDFTDWNAVDKFADAVATM